MMSGPIASYRSFPPVGPDSKRQGREWVARNPTRLDAHLGSFKINLDTGAWADFATDESGGDLVSLYAYLNRLSQGQAALELSEQLGLTDHRPRNTIEVKTSPNELPRRKRTGYQQGKYF
jgi:hypothetical protein